MLRILLGLSLSLIASAAVASPVGEWLVADRSARVAIRQCGPNLCGNISWSSDGQDVGRPILINLRPDGPQWTGTVVDIRDGQRYLAHLYLQSEQQLHLDGCALGGAICDGEVWTRYK